MKDIIIRELTIRTLGLLIFVLSTFGLYAQSSKRLTIGDQTPTLQYSQWIKGDPITSFEKDHVYVFEFWATWCGPCIQSMPHLSELAKQYKGHADIIGVNVWEKTKGEPYESAIPSVKEFVRRNGDRMDYHVIMDNNEEHMGKNWLLAAGQTGIPSTIVIKNDVIQWIGHPHYLDGPLDSIVNGTFDVSSFKQRYEEKFRSSNTNAEKMQRIFKNVEDGIASGDQVLLERYIQEGIKELPSIAGGLKMRMFGFLLDKRATEEAFDYGDTMITEIPQMRLSLAIMVLQKDSLQNCYYKKAISWLDREQVNSLVLELVADRYAEMGDFPAALKAIQEAILKGGSELNDQRYQGRVYDYTIEGYRKKAKMWECLIK